jgi:hypothetical protein
MRSEALHVQRMQSDALHVQRVRTETLDQVPDNN